MRKFVQKQTLELISTVWEGVSYAVSQNTTQSSAADVLKNCCTAVQVIDRSLKTGLSEERYLFYKEMNNFLMEMFESLMSTKINGEADFLISKQIENQLTFIQSELINELEVKLEIVFLPYKSSMWDSLESIWRATKEDPMCNCHVIPIPYFDRSPDTSISELHYEGRDFPDDVPITDFNSYDISALQPDVVYVHNPFDQFNRVTMVHPNYFSPELKKYVGTLVYVPYFVLGGSIPESQMIMFPVYQNLDMMVVQSEKCKEFYQNFVPEHKLLALGSPKIDKMNYFDNHKPPIPQEWVEVIKNKKVVMYNISITSFLKYGMKVIKKVEYVFSHFSGRNDVVLLWRPHPLIEATLKSMIPTLLDAYLKLKEQYMTNNIGIYDTTSDITASVSLSDAYIGEETSSIVHLFGVIGKPIFLLEMEMDQQPTEETIMHNSLEEDFYSLNDNIPYASCENQNLTLNRFINDYVISEHEHDKRAQKQAYSSIFNNMDGTCGEKIHKYIKEQLL